VTELTGLTAQEKHEFSKAFVCQRLNTKEDLKHWLIYYLDVDLADCMVSRYATSTPLDMVWDLYKFCVEKDSDSEPLSTFYIAGRGSQKTLSCAVLQILLPLHFKRGMVHLGGTEDQANRAYSYFKKFVNKPYISDYLIDKPKISKTTFLVDGQEIDVEILPLTESSVQGPHSPVVSIDELASLAPNKLAAYPSIAGIPVYTHDGKPWVKFGISSRKGRYTIIETEYDERHKTGAVFKFWTVLENTKQCPDSISGTEPLTMYVDIFENKAILESEYMEIEEIEKEKYQKVEARKGCFTCPLRAVCGGDLKRQNSTCRSLKPVAATIQDFKMSPTEWFLSQRMSLQPSSEDLVYSKFKRHEFEKTPREIYTIFSGKDPGDITESQLIDLMSKAGVKKYAGVDHGYTHPFAIVIVFEDQVGNVYIVKSYEMSGLEPPEIVETIVKLKEKYGFTHVYPDTASPSINKMISKVVSVGDKFTKSPLDGIALIRDRMCPPMGGTKFYGLKGNVDSLVNNMEKYHFSYDSSGKLTDKPVKEFDDSHDALSYAAQNRWQRSKPIVTADNEKAYYGTKEKQSIDGFREDVQKQHTNWLSKQISSEAKEQGGGTGVKSSKSKGFFWDID